MSEFTGAGRATEFVAGFASRHDAAGHALRAAFATPQSGFAPREIAPAPPGSRPGAGPKHFSPADRAGDPTAGWDPFDAQQQPTGFVDPIATAHATGYAEGQAAALAEARADMARDRALIAALAAAIGDESRIDRDRLARQMRQTVMMLVAQMLGEIELPGDLLAARIASAADLLADSAESALLRVNPADVALLADKLPAAIFPVGDAAVARGSFVLESASTVIEDGPDLWLEQLAQAIDKVAVPR